MNLLFGSETFGSLGCFLLAMSFLPLPADLPGETSHSSSLTAVTVVPTGSGNHPQNVNVVVQLRLPHTIVESDDDKEKPANSKVNKSKKTSVAKTGQNKPESSSSKKTSVAKASRSKKTIEANEKGPSAGSNLCSKKPRRMKRPAKIGS